MDSKIQPERLFFRKIKIAEFLIDEPHKVGSKYIWLLVAIEPIQTEILQMDISF
jgi:hypothetical protein